MSIVPLENETMAKINHCANLLNIVLQSGGSSGKSVPELERTIGLMKKVVERVQKENDELKKAPGVTTQTEIHDLRDENKELKVGVTITYVV